MRSKRKSASGSLYSRLLAAFVLVVLSSTLVISCISAWSNYAIVKARALDQLESVASLKSAEIGQWTNDLSAGLDSMLDEDDRADYAEPLLLGRLGASDARRARERLTQMLGSNLARTRIFDTLSLLDASGAVLVSTAPSRVGQDLATASYFQQGIQRNYLTPPSPGPAASAGPVIVAAHPITAPGAGAIGVLVGYSDISVLNGIMQEPMRLGRTGESYLVDGNLMRLTHLRFKQDDEIAIVESEGARRAVEGRIHGAGSYKDYRGVPVLGVYSWLPALQAAVLVEQDQSEAFLSVARTLLFNLGAAIAAVLLSMLVASILTRNITGPLSTLSRAASRIAEGDLGHAAEIDRHDEIGKLAMAFNRMTGRLRDVIGRLRESDARNRAIVGTAMDGFWRLDRRGRLLEVNQAFCQMSGYGEAELLAMSVADLEALEEPRGIGARIEGVVARGSDRFEAAHRRKDGSEYSIEISIQHMPEQGDTLIAFVRDVTERKLAEEQVKRSLAEKETLLRELHHRTKNNMGVIIALLDLQAMEIGDERLREAFVDTQNRIRAMAMVHQKLYETRDLSRINLKEYVGDLARMLMRSCDVSPGKVELTTDLEDAFVVIDAAIPCGLILNELMTNALKYAFPGEARGVIRVTLRRTGDGAILLRVADDGVGIPPGFDPRRDGHMGIQTVFALGENQLDGEIAFSSAGDFASGAGLACDIAFREDLFQPRI